LTIKGLFIVKKGRGRKDPTLPSAIEKERIAYMETHESTDYAPLDRPEILNVLFHPRQDRGGASARGPARSLEIPVSDGAVIGARFHMADTGFPNILFFHGNGEIASDYDDLGPLYNQMGLNFMVVDYRGYGESTGTPTVSAMMRDCHAIFDFAGKWLTENGFTGPFLVMGRSLGSASALELAAHHPDRISGLIIESGFAHAAPLLMLLGAPGDVVRQIESVGFRHTDIIKGYTGPTLIIHAEYDHIIPFSEGQALYNASGAKEKRLLRIPGANHNDIFARALSEYLIAISEMAGLSG
jgi:pimeloyl-ACP methyl ester carboxylesterase